MRVWNVFSCFYNTPLVSLVGAGTYTTSSLSTKTASTSDPPNICKVKPQQLQTSSLASASHFSQLSCMPSLIAQQQQSPQVYVSQSAAGNSVRLRSRVVALLELQSWINEFNSHFISNKDRKMASVCCYNDNTMLLVRWGKISLHLLMNLFLFQNFKSIFKTKNDLILMTLLSATIAYKHGIFLKRKFYV